MTSIEKLDKNFVAARAEDGLDWYDALELGLCGKGWSQTAAPFTRLPAHGQAMVNETAWKMGLRASGLCVRFATDAASISAKWAMLEDFNFEHMAATGVKGVDLYVRDRGKMKFVGIGVPTPGSLTQSARLCDLSSVAPEMREYCLYLPLYVQVTDLRIGVPAGARVVPAPPLPGPNKTGKPILIYGTSITHGGCASRPGMAYPAIIGRRLDCPVVGLGLDGSAMMYESIAPLFAEVDAAAYVIDSLPNMWSEIVATDTIPFVKRLRQLRPDTPIVLVESLDSSRGLFGSPNEYADRTNIPFRAAVAKLRADGITGLHIVPGDQLVGRDAEGTVDGVHPTDLGFMRIADVLCDRLRPFI